MSSGSPMNSNCDTRSSIIGNSRSSTTALPLSTVRKAARATTSSIMSSGARLWPTELELEHEWGAARGKHQLRGHDDENYLQLTPPENIGAMWPFSRNIGAGAQSRCQSVYLWAAGPASSEIAGTSALHTVNLLFNKEVGNNSSGATAFHGMAIASADQQSNQPGFGLLGMTRPRCPGKLAASNIASGPCWSACKTSRPTASSNRSRLPVRTDRGHRARRSAGVSNTKSRFDL